jgi:hypothetical protein
MPARSRTRDGVSRREFLAVGGISLMSLPVAERLAEARRRGGPHETACVLILLNGGPSPWETFDPKPAAPREIRGPLRAISTSIPGVHFSESLPELAQRADRLTIVRSLYHTAAPIHETGLQLLQSGGLIRKQYVPLGLGARLAASSPAHDVPLSAVIGGALHDTGAAASKGDASLVTSRPGGPVVVDLSGRLALPAEEEAGPHPMTDLDAESRGTRDRYGDSRMGGLLLQARQLVEQGVRCVTVNTFARLEGDRTWDAHGCPRSAPATLFDYQSRIGPEFDRALAGLLDDLAERELSSRTLVVCAGEIGRTPLVNAGGGRDHWTEGFSAVLAGGDAQPGAVIGATSERGGEIVEQPVALESLYARMAAFLKLPATSES